ncbi:MAG TPA: tetratricopeptide repeat protein [Blastocatellia bacterium]|nr:tetratricopeptide repeat protein [Blastocatellia bacterium]
MRPKKATRNRVRCGLPQAVLWLAVASMALAGAACKYSAEKTLERASDAWRAGDYEQAVQLYEGYLQHAPRGDQSLETRLKLANIYYLNLHKYEPALEQYNEYLSQTSEGPETETARERMAEVLAELGRSYQAISEYEDLIPKDDRDRRRIRLRIADLYFDEKNFSQAVTEYDKVTAETSYDDLTERALLREASIYQLERGQFQQAIPLYQKIVAQTSDPKVRTTSLFAISNCEVGLYQYDQAVQTLREVKDESEQGYITRRIGEIDEMKREQQRGEVLRPSSH